MKNKLLIFSVFLMCFQWIWAQTTVSGNVLGVDGKPIFNAAVILLPENITVNTDKIGYFQFKNVVEGEHQLKIYQNSYVEFNTNFNVLTEKTLKLGDMKLEYDPTSINQGIITLTDDELNDDESQNQTGISLLQSSRDAFSRAAAFELGGYWFKARGLDNRYLDVFFNGVQMNKEDDGLVSFGDWGGLNDVTRYPLEIAEGSAISAYSFGNLSSTTQFETRASSFRKGTRLTYSATNRSYRNRLMFSYFSGLSPKGWAVAISASRRWAEEGIIDGTYYDAYGYFLSVEKRISEKHALNLTSFGAPGRRSSNSPNTQETYDLLGKNYNSYWGWYEGEKRNERIKKFFQPINMLTHYWTINTDTSLKTTLSYQTGTSGSSRLDWYNAASPSPTYYRNLPSWAMVLGTTEENMNILYDRWRNDSSFSQINWNSLYNQNLNIPVATYGGETGRRAAYYLVYDKNDDETININTHFRTKFMSNWTFNANVSYQHVKSEYYREVDDLMGADFALNLDDFNNNLPFGGNITAKKGDKIEYDYNLLRNSFRAHLMNEWDIENFNLQVSTLFGYTESFRDGKYVNGLYPNISFGKSKSVHFIDLGLKGQLTYKINGRNFIRYNGAYYTLTPTLNDIFFNPRSNNIVTPNITNQKINSNELSYVLRSPKVKVRLTGYFTTIKDGVDITRYYAQGLALVNQSNSTEGSDAFVSEVLTQIDKKYFGGELGLEFAITSTLTATAVASAGQFIYNNNPNVYVSVDNAIAQGIYDFGKSHLKDYRIGNGPQVGSSFSLRYSSPKFWWIGASANYLAHNYLEVSPILRTSNFYTNPVDNNPYYNPELGRRITAEDVNTILKQPQNSDEFMLNANIGKSFKFGNYYMGLSASVNNILNNRNYITGGFEQGRNANFNDMYEDQQREIPVFAPKYWYDRGLSYFINVYLRF